MKITTITVEANADELRQCNTVADGVLNLLRRCFNGGQCDEEDVEEDDGGEQG